MENLRWKNVWILLILISPSVARLSTSKSASNQKGIEIAEMLAHHAA
jgi:hypothetical protein